MCGDLEDMAVCVDALIPCICICVTMRQTAVAAFCMSAREEGVLCDAPTHSWRVVHRGHIGKPWPT